MRVLFITDDLTPGHNGIAVYSENTIRCLKNEGIETTTFGPKGSSADHFLPSINLIRFLKADTPICFPNLKLIKAILSGRYDVIHINCPKAFTALPVCILARIKKTKVIFFNHGNIALYCKYNFFPSFLAALAARCFVTLSYFPQVLFESTIIQNPGSSDLQLLYKKPFKFKQGYCGINLDIFTFSPTYKKFQLVSVGRLSKEKNWGRLLELFSHLPNHYRLLIIGMGKEENTLRQYCADKGLENITFLGNVTQKELSTHLQNSQAYISSSLFETWGLTLSEALACGTPIVYPKHIPFTTLYANQIPQGCYAIDDEKSFCDAVLHTEHTSVQDRMRLHQIAKGYSWENATRQLISIYQETGPF